MQRYFWLFFIPFFSVLVSSCASSPSPVLPPAKLTVIKSELSIDEKWYRQIGEGVSDRYYLLEPVFSDDKIYVIDYLGVLSAVNQKNGDVLWAAWAKSKYKKLEESIAKKRMEYAISKMFEKLPN